MCYITIYGASISISTAPTRNGYQVKEKGGRELQKIITRPPAEILNPSLGEGGFAQSRVAERSPSVSRHNSIY